MDLGLKGKTALVTGGSTGLGFAIAKSLVEERASVVLVSRSEEKLRLAQERLAVGDRCTFVACDLLNESSLREGIAKIQKHSAIDIVVNNVGGPTAGNIMKLTLEDWDRGYHGLLRSAILLAQAFVPAMQERHWGRILTLTSTSAREIIPRLPISSTFRAGLTAWTKEMAKELGRSGILVNNLLPGPTNTGRLEELKVKNPAFYQSMSTESALGRIGEPEEIGRVGAFLCSSANSFITGTDVLVDGGFTKAL